MKRQRGNRHRGMVNTLGRVGSLKQQGDAVHFPAHGDDPLVNVQHLSAHVVAECEEMSRRFRVLVAIPVSAKFRDEVVSRWLSDCRRRRLEATYSWRVALAHDVMEHPND